MQAPGLVLHRASLLHPMLATCAAGRTLTAAAAQLNCCSGAEEGQQQRFPLCGPNPAGPLWGAPAHAGALLHLAVCNAAPARVRRVGCMQRGLNEPAHLSREARCGACSAAAGQLAGGEVPRAPATWRCGYILACAMSRCTLYNSSNLPASGGASAAQKAFAEASRAALDALRLPDSCFAFNLPAIALLVEMCVMPQCTALAAKRCSRQQNNSNKCRPAAHGYAARRVAAGG